jgi:glioma pathogenesis-related protein 2
MLYFFLHMLLCVTSDALAINSQAVLDTVNSYRSLHQAPSVVFDANLNATAQSWANTLAATQSFQHSNFQYGENLAMVSYNGESDVTSIVLQSVKMWYDEKTQYNYNNPVFSPQTGHFTQLVWAGTQYIGLGYSQEVYNGFPCIVVVMEFYPRGNYIGQFAANVLPLVAKRNPSAPPRLPSPPVVKQSPLVTNPSVTNHFPSPIPIVHNNMTLQCTCVCH